MSVYDFSVADTDGSRQPLQAYDGNVSLIVNVASQCGFTPQYEGLESLYGQYNDQGFQILGFPCNQFGGQEPGTHDEIIEFCQTNYGVSFPVFAKIDVNGDNADPLYQHLRSEDPGHIGPEAGFLYEHLKATQPELLDSDDIKWNFTKFLISRSGDVIKRYEPYVTPEQLQEDVSAALAE